MSTIDGDQSQTLTERDIMPPLDNGPVAADDAMETVMDFFNAGLTFGAFNTIGDALGGGIEIVGFNGPEGGVFAPVMAEMAATPTAPVPGMAPQSPQVGMTPGTPQPGGTKFS